MTTDKMREAFEEQINNEWPNATRLAFEKSFQKLLDYQMNETGSWELFKDGMFFAISSLPRLTEAELAETIYNDVYDSNFDISRLAANILAKFIAAKFPQIIKE